MIRRGGPKRPLMGAAAGDYTRSRRRDKTLDVTANDECKTAAPVRDKRLFSKALDKAPPEPL
ncbi:hypothetical protein AS19_25900 [Alcanivorax sp. NBRC 101098]|nr:hypothetical protein AS19_25900 [Alcanivorax sp. NBRC 101098]